eukprot:RCo050178
MVVNFLFSRLRELFRREGSAGVLQKKAVKFSELTAELGCLLASAGEGVADAPVHFLRSADIGGTGGIPFDQLANEYIDLKKRRIVKIVGYGGTGVLSGISVQYEGMPTWRCFTFGATTGEKKEWVVPADDPVATMTVTCNTRDGPSFVSTASFKLKSGQSSRIGRGSCRGRG